VSRYFEIWGIMLRNSLIRELSFKTNFILWLIVEILWFCGQLAFFGIIFGQVDQIGDWSKWEVILLLGTHQIIAQLFQAFFFMNIAKNSTFILRQIVTKDSSATACPRSAKTRTPQATMFDFTASTSCFIEKGFGRKANSSPSGMFRAKASSA